MRDGAAVPPLRRRASSSAERDAAKADLINEISVLSRLRHPNVQTRARARTHARTHAHARTRARTHARTHTTLHTQRGVLLGVIVLHVIYYNCNYYAIIIDYYYYT